MDDFTPRTFTARAECHAAQDVTGDVNELAATVQHLLCLMTDEQRETAPYFTGDPKRWDRIRDLSNRYFHQSYRSAS
jgi:hypothetical protein